MRKRTYTDDALKQAVTEATTWTGVCHALGVCANLDKNSGPRLRARRLGLDTASLDSRVGGKTTSQLLPSLVIPDNTPRNGADIAVSRCIAWFTKRGHTVSVPIKDAAYDLVVDWGEGLKKVQVKSGTSSSRVVKMYKVKYLPVTETNTWKYQEVPYEDGDVDVFFISMERGTHGDYLIPFESVKGQKTVTLPGVYERYALPS